jgi:hypothetical protein
MQLPPYQYIGDNDDDGIDQFINKNLDKLAESLTANSDDDEYSNTNNPSQPHHRQNVNNNYYGPNIPGQLEQMQDAADKRVRAYIGKRAAFPAPSMFHSGMNLRGGETAVTGGGQDDRQHQQTTGRTSTARASPGHNTARLVRAASGSIEKTRRRADGRSRIYIGRRSMKEDRHRMGQDWQRQQTSAAMFRGV